MREFKKIFEELGYTFPSADVLEDVYLFYKYYNNPANKGVSAILLEGDPGCGKTYLSEVFSEFLGKDTEYIYTQCVEETNSDRLIATYNVPAIVKGDADKSVAEGILTKSINLANNGKKVVLTIDELDKAREVLDSYFLDFLQNGKIETSSNEILSLTNEGRKNLYVILAKNNERNLLDALLRRCSVIKLPSMPPVLAYKTLLKRFENTKHDPKFLKFISKVYEAIYNEQMNSGEELLTRLPALQELITAITSDNELYENGISSTRRINSLIRKLGKDSESREIITNILTQKFKYENKESNYGSETLDIDMNDPDDYMNTKDADSLVEQYIEKKDNGEYIFEEEEEFEDPMKDVANILDNMKDDESLVFLDKEHKDKIVELGVITHQDPKALEILFNKIKFRGNPNSRFGFLNFEDDNFIGLMKYKNTLILISNKEYISPRLLIRGLCTIITIIYDRNQNINYNDLYYFDSFLAQNFKLSGFNAKILSNIPKLVIDKMSIQNGIQTYQTKNLKVTYDDSVNTSYFRYLQKYQAEPFYEAIEKICEFNPELAIPASFINGKVFNGIIDRDIVCPYSEFEQYKYKLETLKNDGWEIIIDEFEVMELSEVRYENSSYSWEEPKKTVVKNNFIFKWNTEIDENNKKMHIYPKYELKNQYVLYTSDKDFYEDQSFKQLSPFQKEIALMAKNIFGNFIPVFSHDSQTEYFSSLTMSHMGRILENENIGSKIPGISQDITQKQDFRKYYDYISEPTSTIAPYQVLKRTL